MVESFKGAAEKVKGTVKAIAGEALGDAELQEEGMKERAKGKAQGAGEETKDVATTMRRDSQRVGPAESSE